LKAKNGSYENESTSVSLSISFVRLMMTILIETPFPHLHVANLHELEIGTKVAPGRRNVCVFRFEVLTLKLEGCDAVWQLRTFLIFFYHESGGGIFLRNVVSVSKLHGGTIQKTALYSSVYSEL
jgi:hypothetical protein